MKNLNLGRRRFLRGSGGVMLALPVLPSLYANDALAQAAASQKCFVNLISPHGGVSQSRMFPAAGVSERLTYAGHEVRRGALSATSTGGQSSLSEVLRAPSALLTPALVAKMNVVNGIDVPFYNGHNGSQSLGNFANSDQADPAVISGARRMTIDQIMAWHPGFYTSLSTVKERAIVRGGSSWTWSVPSSRSGTFQRTGQTATDNVQLFDKLFGTTTAPSRPLIVDQVLDSYRRLRDGNARLSAADKQRLTDHMDRLYELQRKLQASAARTPPPRPTTSTRDLRGQSNYTINPALQSQNEQLWNSIVVAGLSTGVSSIYVQSEEETFSSFSGDWHQDVVHRNNEGSNMSTLAASYQLYFERVVLDLVSRMNAVANGVGGTLLDNALVVWTHESGNRVHDSLSVPFITFGGAAGAVRTGQYLDYRNLSREITQRDGTESQWPGLLMHQWCGTVLQSMGIPRSAYENLSQNGGYPDFRYPAPSADTRYPGSVWAATPEALPWFRA